MIETISERITDVVEYPLQNVIMPSVSSADADTPAAKDLSEVLKNPMSNAHFATKNKTHHTALINVAELFSIIPKGAKQQSTDRNIGLRHEV